MNNTLQETVSSATNTFLEQEKKRIAEKNSSLKEASEKETLSSKIDYSKVFTKEEMLSFEDRVSSEIESESYKEKYIRSSATIRAEEWQLFIKRNIPDGASHRGLRTGIFYKADDQGLSADFWGDSIGGWVRSGLFNTTLNDEKYFIKL